MLSEGEKVQLYHGPSMNNLVKGELLEGKKEILSDGWIQNSQGIWIRIAGLQRYILAEVSH